MGKDFLEWLVGLIASGDVHPFYVSPQWRRLNDEVMRLDLHECQICKAHGRYAKAEIVHHVNHIKQHPGMALDIYAPDGTRNLISVCRKCHENVCHPERIRKYSEKKTIYPEKWD